MYSFLHKRRECVISPLARPLSSLASGSSNRSEVVSPGGSPGGDRDRDRYMGAAGVSVRFDHRNVHRQLRESDDIDMLKLSAESLPENRLSSFQGNEANDLSPQVRRRAQSSSAVDLAARRGVFSRRHYGSVELLVTNDRDGMTSGRFRVEDGERDEISTVATGSDVHLENPEYHTRWYFKYFLGKIHQNYVGADVDKNIFFLSVVLTDANNHNVPQYRAILWRKTGTQKICIPYNSAKSMSVKRILGRFDLKIDKSPKEIYTPDIQKELLLLEEQEGSVNFKFGVLYAKNGQKSDDEMFSNEHPSEAFSKLVGLLGETIPLKGWEKFNGGLDVKNNTTGTESVYTMYEGHEIMFHVSTLLPYSKDNRQQVERKRHVGNDIVTIVYMETDDAEEEMFFKPSMIRSHFTHIFALVTYNKNNDTYRLRVYSEESVPLFGPPLPAPAVFDDHQAFRDFLLVKLINGEKAAFNTPIFANKRQRTLEMLIKNLQQDMMQETNKQNMLNKRSFSDVIPDPVWGWRSKKEEARQAEFVRIGQVLKLKTIVKGDAPTSLATTSLLKREPWEPQCIQNDFLFEIVCGDSWGDKLIVGTESGVFIIEEGLSPRMIFDKTVSFKQLSVVEAHGLLLARADKGKDGRIYVFRLSDFEGEENEGMVRTKNDCRNHKIERSKGCHLFAVSRPGGSHLRMVIAVGKKLVLMTWKHNAAWSAWCKAADTDTVEGFQFTRELSAGDVPNLMCLIDGGHGDNHIVVGYRHQFDLINEKNGDTFRLHMVDANKVNLVSAVDIYEDDEPEVLLSYNHVSQFRRLNGEASSDFDMYWNSAPRAIVCAFPYILAFTPDSVEIRLVVNGNLVHTMTMPRINLITSKCDMYFTSTGMDILQPSPKEPVRTFSPLPSPTSPPQTYGPFSSAAVRIFKIPLISLVGQMSERPVPNPNNNCRPRSFISPLVNIAESPPTPARRFRLSSGSPTTTEEQTDASSEPVHIVSIPVAPLPSQTVSKVKAGPRPSQEYSDSGYSESDFSFESTDSLPGRYPSSPCKGLETAETRRHKFGCLRSPRLGRRQQNSTQADPDARAELLGTPGKRVGTRTRFTSSTSSTQSDSVFYPLPPRIETNNNNNKVGDSDVGMDFIPPPRSPLADRLSSTSSSISQQSEAEMRAELLGRLIHSPRLERPSNTSSLQSEDGGSVFLDQPSVDKTTNGHPPSPSPFALSTSVDDDDIDLK
ncbi:GTPase-activating Rap/Ran-GAP domain-like protein 3 isoform X1 [Diadema antillarum]|uniref:GTPase-activating Rap/Ran-GAP domain-like protein 3 isoform X1 n=1 Tax=Diadema antillarum TaxID=105358 RepID=UPI003A8B98B8